MGDSNNSPTQKINYFMVGEYLEAIRYFPYHQMQSCNLLSWIPLTRDTLIAYGGGGMVATMRLINDTAGKDN